MSSSSYGGFTIGYIGHVERFVFGGPDDTSFSPHGAGLGIPTDGPMTDFPGLDQHESPGDEPTMLVQTLPPSTPKKPMATKLQLLTPDPTPVGKRYVDRRAGKPTASSAAKARTQTPSANRVHKRRPSKKSSVDMTKTAVDRTAPLSPPAAVPLISCGSFDVALLPAMTHDVVPLPAAPGLMSPGASPFDADSEMDSVRALTNALDADPDQASPMDDGLEWLVDEEMDRLTDEYLGNTPPGDDSASPEQAEAADEDEDGEVAGTGITEEEIAAFMHGPEPADGKWVCLFVECGKRFGRKENIKSHVQTHLGDRQFRCRHCHKRFVRQHDLKRHAKIHSGVKPFACACGNTFARQDALTRHRQRGCCIGAYAGVVKKAAKRGRPRKIRPEDDRSAAVEGARVTAEPMSTSSSSSGTSATSAFSTSSGSSSYMSLNLLTQPLAYPTPMAAVAVAAALSNICTPPPSPGLSGSMADWFFKCPHLDETLAGLDRDPDPDYCRTTTAGGNDASWAHIITDRDVIDPACL
ncbi:MAG: Metallothionein expression activator [Phylliscum demangeonii]|nr:MAG: Metallothionein expression activator [Phylliscum demangeonii]